MKMYKKIIAIVLLASTLILSSCKISPFPRWYTGGFNVSEKSGREYYWFETYDELVDALDKLYSHDSTVFYNGTITYDGDLFDVQYCLYMNDRNADKSHTRFSDPFDRQVKDVTPYTYIFLEDVTVDEITRSLVREYECYLFNKTVEFRKMAEEGNFTLGELRYEWNEEFKEYYIYSDDLKIFVIDPVLDLSEEPSEEHNKLSDEALQAIMNSIVFIGTINTPSTYFYE